MNRQVLSIYICCHTAMENDLGSADKDVLNLSHNDQQANVSSAVILATVMFTLAYFVWF